MGNFTINSSPRARLRLSNSFGRRSLSIIGLKMARSRPNYFFQFSENSNTNNLYSTLMQNIEILQKSRAIEVLINLYKQKEAGLVEIVNLSGGSTSVVNNRLYDPSLTHSLR